MAKKNSTKTATKEALQASEPRINPFQGWQGINIAESPLEWVPDQHGYYGGETADRNDSNLRANFLVVQNNIKTTNSLALETRHDTKIIAEPPDGTEFNGVCCLREDILFCAFTDNTIRYKQLSDYEKDDWHTIKVTDWDDNLIEETIEWSSINYYQNSLICLTKPKVGSGSGEIFTGSFNGRVVDEISNARKIPEPTIPVTLTPRGSLKEGEVTRVSIGYTYSNKFGSTMDVDGDWATATYDSSPVQWHSGCYLNITGDLRKEYGSDLESYQITGVDLYCRLDENMDAIFIGHVGISPGQEKWSYQWLGALMDTSMWTNVSLTVPTENTTKGVDASFMRIHDGRLFFWGGSYSYRLWIGGNPGNELSVARGTGGAWVDIEPGNGMEVKGTAKFKTYNGASIITIMCGNRNSGKVKRYNLLETNLTISNELSTKGYMTEEVANVVGCTSHWGFGAWADGLYSLNRYGLMLTTMAMENSNQLRATPVSDAISPIFEERMANRLANAHMIFINDIIYIAMGDERDTGDTLYEDLDRLILCYDVNTKAWYTFTYDLDEPVRSMFNIDSEEHWEGIGIITPQHVCLIPVTGEQKPEQPKFDGVSVEDAFEVMVETGELMIRQPAQATIHLSQIEFKFDYFVGDLEITVDGIDYYGRKRTVLKKVHLDEVRRSYPVWMRIDELFETYKITMRGKARFRLTHFLAKTYVTSNKVDQVYGFTDHSWYANRHGGDTDIHHYLKSYNNLREAIVT